MKFVLISMLVSVVIILCVFSAEEFIIQKLPDTNKFKKWWRNNVIGVFEESEDI